MITYSQAYKIAMEDLEDKYILGSSVEFPDFWTFSVRFRKTGKYTRTSPLAIDKHDGHIFIFFPPYYSDEFCRSGRQIPFEELEQVMNPEDLALSKKYKETDLIEKQNIHKKLLQSDIEKYRRKAEEMSVLICNCEYAMNDNMDIVDFRYLCFNNNLFNHAVEYIKGITYEFYDDLKETQDIYRCPKCNNIYWFEYKKRYADEYTLIKSISLAEYHNSYSCECGRHFKNKELIHCFSEEEKILYWDSVDEAVEHSLSIPEFKDSKVHIWKCPDCNRLYWIERDAGIVQCYVKQDEE